MIVLHSLWTNGGHAGMGCLCHSSILPLLSPPQISSHSTLTFSCHFLSLVMSLHVTPVMSPVSLHMSLCAFVFIHTHTHTHTHTHMHTHAHTRAHTCFQLHSSTAVRRMKCMLGGLFEVGKALSRFCVFESGKQSREDQSVCFISEINLLFLCFFFKL